MASAATPAKELQEEFEASPRSPDNPATLHNAQRGELRKLGVV